MCTSFLYRGNDTIFAMNYDFYGGSLRLAPYRGDRFLATAELCGREQPLFGVRSGGVFANQQLVAACGSGGFRTGGGAVSTTELAAAVLSGKLPMAGLEGYLDDHEVVSPPEELLGLPGFQIHMLLGDARGGSYILEPGRGILKFGRETKAVVLSNCPLCETAGSGRYEGFGADRQRRTEELLGAADERFRVADAFSVLREVQLVRYQGRISTELSFVYSAGENSVYYCRNREFDKIQCYRMKKAFEGDS